MKAAPPRVPPFRRCGGPPTCNGVVVSRSALGADHTPRAVRVPEVVPQPRQRARATRARRCGKGRDDAQTLKAHMEMLWQHHEVPAHHRELYAHRYFQACSHEVLLREASALAAGTAYVQVAQKAVANREDILASLQRLRLAHRDHEFENEADAGSRELLSLITALRKATVDVVEAVCTWRRSVAPLPGCNATQQRASSTIAGPGLRGASWPYGTAGTDYLWTLVHDDAAVRAFDAVLSLSAECDPFLLLACEQTMVGKLSLPQIFCIEFEQIEAAKILLLEEEVATSIVGQAPSNSPSLPAGGACQKALHPAPSAKVQPVVQAHLPQTLLPYLWPLGIARAEGGNSRPQSALPHKRKALNDSIGSEKATGPRPKSASQAGCKNTLTRAARRARAQITELAIDIPEDHPEKHVRQRSKCVDMTICLSDRSETKASSSDFGDMLGLPVITPHPTPVHSASRSKGLDLLADEAISDGENDEEGEDAGEGDPRLNDIFKKFADDGSIHHDDAHRALQLVGIGTGIVDEKLATKCFREITQWTTMKVEEFQQFVRKYETLHRADLEAQFNSFDDDASGMIDIDELGRLLTGLGIEPMQHCLEEVINEVDVDGNGTVDLQEFYEVMNIVHTREGFCRSEYELFVQTFQKFDTDRTDSINADQLIRLLSYLGFVMDDSDAMKIMKEVDVDGSGRLNQQEFLVCMRKVRDSMVQTLKSFLEVREHLRSGSAILGELGELLTTLGYFPNHEVIAQVCEDISTDKNRHASIDLNLSQLWRFIFSYRSREGLSNDDITIISKAFERYTDGRADGELHTSDVGKMIRSLGFSLPFECQQALRNQVDVDDSGSLDQDEVYKLIRLCREQEIQAAMQLFKEKCGPNQLLLMEDVEDVLVELHCVDRQGNTPKIVSTEVADEGFAVDMPAFVHAVCQQHESNRQLFLENGGFSEEEITELRLCFERFDEDNSGDISRGELVQLIEAFFPKMSQDAKLRPMLCDIITEVDENGNGKLDFNDYLRLMQMCLYHHDKEQLIKEREAITGTDFSTQEVSDFRDLFMSFDEYADGEIPVSSVTSILGKIVKLGDRHITDLEAKLKEICSLEELDEKEEIDFPEFLWLMRWVLDMNFASIKEATDGAFARYRSFCSPRNARISVAMGHNKSDLLAVVGKGEKRQSQRQSLRAGRSFTFSSSNSLEVAPPDTSSDRCHPRRDSMTRGLNRLSMAIPEKTTSGGGAEAKPERKAPASLDVATLSVGGLMSSGRRPSSKEIAEDVERIKADRLRSSITSSAGDTESNATPNSARMRVSFSTLGDVGDSEENGRLSTSNRARDRASLHSALKPPQTPPPQSPRTSHLQLPSPGH